jgi:hypothetical protein
MSASSFVEKSAALRDAQRRLSAATAKGQLAGAVVAIPVWLTSDAPWWGVPVFLIVGGWAIGRICASVSYQRSARILNALYPEMKL